MDSFICPVKGTHVGCDLCLLWILLSSGESSESKEDDSEYLHLVVIGSRDGLIWESVRF